MMDVKHLPIFINSDELPQDVLRIVKIINPHWPEENTRFKVFTDGITNKLIGCYLVTKPKNIILVRVYGEKTDLYIDRVVEMQNFKLMNTRGYAPKLYATFNNGLAYDYIDGNTLTTETCRDKTVYPLVASMLAKMHKLRYEETSINSLSPNVWSKSERFISLIPDNYTSSEKQSRFSRCFPMGKDHLKNELQQLKKQLQDVNNPVVFCHNDLLLANVIYTGNSVSFIDFEYAGYNYQAFDIANHFNEFAGVTEFNPSLYPSEGFQQDWIRIYLEEYENVVNVENVRQLYENVCKFTPLSHFFWAMWALVQAHHSNIDFDYIEYAILRYNEYKKSLYFIHS